MTIRVAVIGASFARAAYLPALKTVEDVELTAIASARRENAQSAADAFGIAQVYDDWRDMLAAQPYDLICVVTPVIDHAPMTLAALEAGAHVICEKPMAMNTDEARAMLERAEKLGRVHLINHELRFNPNRRKIKRLIDEGVIGQIRHINILAVGTSWGDPAGRPLNDWWSLASKGGGRLGAGGSHHIDLVRFWAGEIAAVSGQLKTHVIDRIDKTTGTPWQADADDQVSITAELASGGIASLFMSSAARAGATSQAAIYGSEGTIRIVEGEEKLWLARPGEDFQDVSEADPNATLPGIGKGVWNLSTVGLIHEAAAAIREDRIPREGATFADGLRCQIVMDAVRQSWAERRWITTT